MKNGHQGGGLQLGTRPKGRVLGHYPIRGWGDWEAAAERAEKSWLKQQEVNSAMTWKPREETLLDGSRVRCRREVKPRKAH